MSFECSKFDGNKLSLVEGACAVRLVHDGEAAEKPEEVGHGHVTYARTRFSIEISV